MFERFHRGARRAPRAAGDRPRAGDRARAVAPLGRRRAHRAARRRRLARGRARCPWPGLNPRPVLPWIMPCAPSCSGRLAALAGILVAAGITLAASSLSSQRIGLSSEPLSAGDALVPGDAGRAPTPPPTRRPAPQEAKRARSARRRPRRPPPRSRPCRPSRATTTAATAAAAAATTAAAAARAAAAAAATTDAQSARRRAPRRPARSPTTGRRRSRRGRSCATSRAAPSVCASTRTTSRAGRRPTWCSRIRASRRRGSTAAQRSRIASASTAARLGVPVVLLGDAAEDQPLAVGEQARPRRADRLGHEELIHARVLDHHVLPAHRAHRRVRHQIARSHAGAVHDDRRHGRSLGERFDRPELDRDPRRFDARGEMLEVPAACRSAAA